MIILRELEVEDLEFLNGVRNECSKEYLHNSETYTLSETIEWFEKTNPKFWLILNGDVKIGYFRTSEYSQENRNLYIGADIDLSFRGKGYAYEAYIKFIPFIFTEMSLHKISLEVLSTNYRAINLYKKLGFIVDGIKREELLKDGVWVDSIIMSILKSDYENL